jgi:acetyl-CoA C-acetyltransferase
MEKGEIGMAAVYIVEGVRTPIGDFLGGLSSLRDVELGIVVAKEVVKRAGLNADAVEEVVCGMVYKGGAKGNPGRQIQIGSGFPETGYASTVDQQCGSGMRAVEMVSQQILLGKTGIGVAVGVESMSNAAYVLENARKIRMGDVRLIDTLTKDGLTCAMCNYHMGITAENLAEKYSISREDQDSLALISHQRARTAQSEGKFKDEIVPVVVPGRKGDTIVDTDEHPRELTVDDLQKLRPAFKKDGTVTAGNASSINDGAAALLLASESAVEEYGLTPKARILATAAAGVSPEIMGIGPVYAIPRALEYAGVPFLDVNYFEINEAFAAQFLACNLELNIMMNNINANGSGIALGHPVGSTGVRIIVSLMSEMERRKSRIGVASLCVGGGPAIACVVELL